MTYTDVLYEVKDQIAWLTINRPDQGNAFRRHTIIELIHALNQARNDVEVRVVVLTGAGDRFFCIGGEKEPNDGMLHYHNVPPVVDLYSLIDMMPVPVIAMGGVGKWDDLVAGVKEGHADAVAAGNIFHYTEHSTKKAKEFMIDAGLPVRGTAFYKVAMPRRPKYRPF